MTKRTIRAGKTKTTNGNQPHGDTLYIDGSGAQGGTGGTAIVTTAATNAGSIFVFGGLAEQAGSQGGLLEVVGVLTDQGSIEIEGGRYQPLSGTTPGQGGTLSVSGTLLVLEGGSVQVDGGLGGVYSQFGPALAGVVENSGLIENGGLFTLGAGTLSEVGGAGATLQNSGSFLNTGSLILQGGVSYYQSSYGDAATLIDVGVLTNSGLLTIQGGEGGVYYGAGADGSTLTILSGGVVTNSGSILVAGGGAAVPYILNYGRGGGGGSLIDQGSLLNSGTIELQAGVTGPQHPNGGKGAVASITGTVTSTGTILIDGSAFVEGPIPSTSGATLVVDGVLTSSGLLTIGAGGASTTTYGYPESGMGGVLQFVFGTFTTSGSLVIAGGAAGAAYGQGGPGGTLTTSSNGFGLISNTGDLVVGGGSGASEPGYAGSDAGSGGLFLLDTYANNTGNWLVQGGTGGTDGGANGSGGLMDVEGYFENEGQFEIAAGTGGGASGTLVVNGILQVDRTMDNDGVIVLGPRSSTQGGGELHNAGLIEGSGVITCSLENDGTISVASGQLRIDSAAVEGTGIITVGASAFLRFEAINVAASQSIVLAGPNSILDVSPGSAGALVVSSKGGTLELINPGDGPAVLNVADTNLSVFLASASNLTLSRMSAIAATGSSGNDTITALSSGQTLTGGLGADILTGAAATGDVFRDVAAGLNGDTIADFAGTDTIDLTDIAPGAGLHLAYQQHGSSGMLTVQNGSASTTITLQGQFSTGVFATANDGHGGVLITLHG